jgi:hypothetical protein
MLQRVPLSGVSIRLGKKTRDRYYDYDEKFGGKMAFLTQNKAKLCKILIITLLFEKNAKFFTENCDHNIDPRKDKLG